MTFSPSGASAQLPDRPSLGLLSSLAKALRKAHGARQPAALGRLKANHPRFKSCSTEQIAAAAVSLRDAQLVIAREHGFEHWAALKQHVMSLVQANAGEQDVKLLMEAAERGDEQQARKLLDAHPEIVNARGGEGMRTALHRAAWKKHQALVELLLDRGADPTIRDVGDNATALHFAAEQGAIEIVKLLVEQGADPNGFGDLHGLDVIGWATCVKHVHREVAEYLLANGAQHNIFSAVAMGDVEAIRRLASFNRDVLDKPMAIWEERRRPLHLAVIKKQPGAVAALLEVGADIEATNIDDLTALDQAALRGDVEIARLLMEHGAKIHLPAAFGLRRKEAIETLLREEPDALRPGNRWAGLLNIACNAAPGDVIASLIEHGASVHARVDSKAFGTKQYTPLHDAAWGGNLEAIEVLVRHGADPEAKDGTYQATPLGWAEYAGRKEAAELLRKYEGEK